MEVSKSVTFVGSSSHEGPSALRVHSSLGIAARWLTFSLWFSSVAITLSRHEFWRDEVRAFSYAKDAHSIRQLLAFLKDDGHPMLWHLLLKLGFLITGSSVALPLVSVAVAAAAVGLLLSKSPLPTSLNTLFVFGALPLYEYSVMARNYGISMLLLFAFAAAYRVRRSRPVLVGAVLALLCNSNVHSLMIASFLGALWLWDTFTRDKTRVISREGLWVAVGAVLAACGAALALFTIWPSDQMISVDRPPPAARDFLAACWRTLIHPSGAFHASHGTLANAALDLLLVLALMSLMRTPRLLVVAVAVLVSFSLFFQLVYPGSLRHRGLFVVLLVSLLWVASDEPREREARLFATASSVGHAALLILLGGLVVIGLRKIRDDLLHPLSSSRQFASFLKSNPELASATLIGEPDYLLESMPYYVNNPIYIPREQRFGRAARFVRSAQLDFDMRRLLNAARETQRRTHAKVLLVVGLPLDWEPRAASEAMRWHIDYGHRRTFTWSTADLMEWRAATTLLAQFSAAAGYGDEVYKVFALNSPAPSNQPGALTH